MEEIEQAYQRHAERRREYLLELGIPDRKQSKPRKFVEDDDDVPDLQDEDDDSDDEDTPSRHQTSNWRDAHKIAAHATSSTTSPTSTKNTGSSPTSRSTKSKQTTSEPRSDMTPNTQTIQNLWHQRLGHPNNRRLREMATNPIYIARGFPALSPRQLDMKTVCDACMIGKSHKITSHKEISHDATKKGQSWSVDVTGRKDTPALGDQATMACVFIEHFTRLSVTYTIKNNDENTILGVLKRWNEEYLSLAKSWHKDDPTLVYFLHSDNLEMAYKSSQRYLTSIGVKSKLTDPNHSS